MENTRHLSSYSVINVCTVEFLFYKKLFVIRTIMFNGLNLTTALVVTIAGCHLLDMSKPNRYKYLAWSRTFLILLLIWLIHDCGKSHVQIHFTANVVS